MSEHRIHNFGAGPAVLPEPVLQQAQKDIWNIAGSGIGIMEHSHRGKVFDRVITEAELAWSGMSTFRLRVDQAIVFLDALLDRAGAARPTNRPVWT